MIWVLNVAWGYADAKIFLTNYIIFKLYQVT